MKFGSAALSRALEMKSISENWENITMIVSQCEAIQLLAIEKSNGLAYCLCKAPSAKVSALASTHGIFPRIAQKAFEEYKEEQKKDSDFRAQRYKEEKEATEGSGGTGTTQAAQAAQEEKA